MDKPLSVVPVTNDRFFPHEEINAQLWDKYTPYQLVMLYVADNEGPNRYYATPWRFTLPIPPQELSIDMPIAVNLQPTLTGIASQHGGAPFRQISLQGTTGIAPQKNRGEMLKQRGVVESIFAGAINNALSTKQSVQRVLDAAQIPNVNTGISELPSTDTIPETSTGYYQMRLMERFIESYVQMKTGGTDILQTFVESGGETWYPIEPNKLRLAFCIWKDQSVYLVEPLQFTKRRSAASPMEYTFALQLRAYKRISLDRTPPELLKHSFAGRDPSKLAAIFNRFRAASDMLEGVQDVYKSFVFDPTNLLSEALRETSLFLAEASGVGAAVTDMPKEIVTAFKTQIVRDWMKVRSNFVNYVNGEVDSQLAWSSKELNAWMTSYSPRGQTPEEIENSDRNKSPLSLRAPPGNELDATEKNELDRVINKILRNVKVTSSSISIPTTIRAKAYEELSRINKLTRSDFEKNRDLVVEAAATFANKVGAGHSSYTATYGGAVPIVRVPTDAEMDVLFSLNELAQQLDHLAVSSSINTSVPSSIEYVAGLAERSGIAFKMPVSKLAVPFPYGMTLERMALLYLGDANRWHEIAALNGLRAPYVDETGFKLPLTVNGSNNMLIVADGSNLYPRQTIWLSSNNVKREKRHITRVEPIAKGECLVVVDGASDLAKFTVAAGSVLEAFLPGTVNSQQIIYIPSTNPVPEDPRTKQVPGVDEYDDLLQVSGIDLLLTPDGDLAITPDGDCKLAYGLANIVQTVKIALSTERGSLLQHPSFGLSVPIGISTADVDPQQIVNATKKMFNNDPMFSGVRSAVVTKDGPVLKITLDVGIAGTSQFIPITVQLA